MKKKESDFVEDCWMFPRAPCLGDSDDEKDDFHGFLMTDQILMLVKMKSKSESEYETDNS